MPDDTEIAGLLSPGNIDLLHRPVVRNADGSISTVKSMSFEEDGKEILVPTVSEDGRILSTEEAINQYRQTGKHLGIFDSPENATAYAKWLHEKQSDLYSPSKSKMPDNQYTGDGGLGFDYEDVPQAVAPPPATFGYMYGSSRYANEPPVPRPTQAQLEALPANTLTDIPTGGWAYRETVPHQERLMQLDREAQKAQQAAQFAAQDAQMFAQMSRVARSMKDIEVARRAIDFQQLTRELQNAPPGTEHRVLMRHPLALGSAYGSAVQHATPVSPPRWVPPSNGAPGYFVEANGNVQLVPPPPVASMLPQDRKPNAVKDSAGNIIGYDVGGGRIMPPPKPPVEGKLTDVDKQRLSAIAREETATRTAIDRLKPSNPKYVAGTNQLAVLKAERDGILGGVTRTNTIPRSAVFNPKTGKWELK